MSLGIYKTLPKNYFNGLYSQVAYYLDKGQNVLVSTITGGGAKTFIAFFVYQAKNEKTFDHIIFVDPTIETKDPTLFIKSEKERKKGRVLVILRLSNQVKEKSLLLEQLNRLRQPFPERLVYLGITDHTGLTDPENYFGLTDFFFAERRYISPFDQVQTYSMIQILDNYYKWDTSPKLYNEIFNLSGGIPSMIKFVTKYLYDNKIIKENIKASLFLEDPIILFQLQYLTKLLLTNNHKQLVTLKIVDSDGRIISSLLEAHFKNFKSRFIIETLPELSPYEEKVLSFLYENKNSLVSIEKIGDLMEMTGYNYSLWAIYKLISKLRKKLPENLILKNIRGKGYILRINKESEL